MSPTHQWSVTDRAGATASRSVAYAVGQPPVAGTGPIVGINTQAENLAQGKDLTYSSTWPAARVYRLSHAATAVASFGSRIVAVTDDPGMPATGGAAVATTLRNALEAFYYGSGAAARADVEYHFALRNEMDREYQSGALPPAVVDTYRRCYQVIHETNAAGVRRYPNASCWVDMTTWQIRQFGAGPRFKSIAPYLDGVAASLYPPGREDDPVTWTPYADYIEPVLAVAADWRASYPQCAGFACWETGSPADRIKPDGTPNSGGPSNYTIRPRYFAGGRDSAGKTHEGFMNYLVRRCAALGLQLQEICYWNSDVGVPNQFSYDRGKTTPDTATAWRNWTPGTTLPNA